MSDLLSLARDRITRLREPADKVGQSVGQAIADGCPEISNFLSHLPLSKTPSVGQNNEANTALYPVCPTVPCIRGGTGGTNVEFASQILSQRSPDVGTNAGTVKSARITDAITAAGGHWRIEAQMKSPTRKSMFLPAGVDPALSEELIAAGWRRQAWWRS